MKSTFYAIIILFAGLTFLTNAAAQEKETVKKPEKKIEQSEMKDAAKDEVIELKELNKESAAEEGKPFNIVCPVSTEEADPNITYTYEGKTYAVCCNSCLKKFKKDPEKYISRLSEDGKSIKKKK